MNTLLHSLSAAALGAVAFASIAVQPARAGEAMTADAVVELFTSQGCSSCPPADRVAGELSKNGKLIVLSMPVDYWDYLGWKDTFAQHAFTERQRTYARARGDGQVYTPQVVVNGLQHAVGSDESGIEAAVTATTAELKDKRVSLKLVPGGDGITVEIGAAPAGLDVSKARVLLADFKSAADVKIGRGENSGSKVTYYHVVRDLTEIGQWSGKAQTLHVSKADLAKGGADGCAVLLQLPSGGPILAGAQLTNW